MKRWVGSIIGCIVLLLGCGTPGARPTDMSVAGHEAAARNLDEQATSEELRQATHHRKMAADHRAASAALRDAEARWCAGMSDEERDLSPFERRASIVDAQPLYKPWGRSSLRVGAFITLRAAPGMTKQHLDSLIQCHMARNASMGFSMPEMADCPLAVKGASATIEPAPAGGFYVEISAELDEEATSEIIRRALALRDRR